MDRFSNSQSVTTPGKLTGNTRVNQDEAEWSPTKPSPKHDVYYPGTEELKPDEIRVIVCGSGMPMPRLKQAASRGVLRLLNRHMG